jgi:hypothetical protein
MSECWNAGINSPDFQTTVVLMQIPAFGISSSAVLLLSLFSKPLRYRGIVG